MSNSDKKNANDDQKLMIQNIDFLKVFDALETQDDWEVLQQDDLSIAVDFDEGNSDEPDDPVGSELLDGSGGGGFD